MLARPGRLAALALLLAALLGAAVGGVSALSSVETGDPRPSGGLPSIVATPTATPTPTPTASTAATATATPSPSPQPTVWLYDVQVGDSISGIAIRFGTTTERLLELNPEYQVNVNLIEAGAQVIVPCTPIAIAEARC